MKTIFQFSFSDVLNLLKKKKFDEFDSIIRTDPQHINSLRDSDGFTLLMRVVGDFETFKHLVRFHHPNLSMIDKNGRNIFHFIVVLRSDDDAMKMLTFIDEEYSSIQWRQLLNQQNYDKRTPLHEAAMLNKHRTISFYLERGTDVEMKDDSGFRPDKWILVDEETKKFDQHREK